MSQYRFGVSKSLLFFLVVAFIPISLGQEMDFESVPAVVDFSRVLREWDGFGFNYVETCQTTNYSEWPQDYGGFSKMDDAQKRTVINRVFGPNGLKVGLVKMFLDPWHQDRPGGPFHHARTTQNMREFVKMGLKETRRDDRDLQIITTLYEPPAYMTKQKSLRGRDLDPTMKEALVAYLVDWVAYLKDQEKLPVKYLSLHNEGEDWLYRWPRDGSPNIGHGHDYNMFWPPQLVAELIPRVKAALTKRGLNDVGVTNGEPTNWYRLYNWGYAYEITNHPEALRDLGLITSHGFWNQQTLWSEHSSLAVDAIRAKRPDVHAWVTSTSWKNMDVRFVMEIHDHIYNTRLNGLIPWAGIQHHEDWLGGDPNPGCALKVDKDGTALIQRGYYYYKQLTTAGQPGMAVCETYAMNSLIAIMAFGANGTKNPDSFVVTNLSGKDIKVRIQVKATSAKTFRAFRTRDEGDCCHSLKDNHINDGHLIYNAPGRSVTTFQGYE